MPLPRTCPQCGAALPDEGWDGLCPKCLVRVSLEERGAPARSEAREPSSEPSSIQRFGEYELLQEIARGGMGVVYKARQRSLNRIVALKMILAGQLASAEGVRRFRAEAEAAARLQHPNIVAIHEIGQLDGHNFYSMDFVEGQDLAEFVRNTPLPAKQAARYLKTISEAIHYAHEHGILHRDLKPSNVLIDQLGQPRITDFGVAKQMTGESDLTLTGQVLGSPSFIPPEQAAARHGQMGPPSDVYALGAILYFLLTARPPFASESLTDTLQQVLSNEPPPPRLLNPSVARDLETICLKCLEKEPRKRYATAQELADELGRFLRDDPILARRAGRAEKTWRWCRRNPVVSSLGALSAVLVVMVAIGSPIALFHINRERRHAEQNARNEALQRERADQELWKSYLAQARANRWSGRVGQRFNSLEVLRKAAALGPSMELRNEAIACMALPDLRTVKEWDLGGSRGRGWRFDPQFQRYACIDLDAKTISLRRVEDDLELMPASNFPWLSFDARFSPNGQYLAVACGDKPGGLRVWDLNQEPKKIILQPPNLLFRCMDFSPDNKTLAVASRRGGPVTLFDLASGKTLQSFTPANEPSCVAFSPDGRKLAVSSEQSDLVDIRDIETGDVLRSLPHPQSVKDVSWHSGGNYLATACADHNVYVWDTISANIHTVLKGHEAPVRYVHFDHAGDFLASIGWDVTMRLWDFRSERQILNMVAVPAGFSADDRWLNASLESGPAILEFAKGRECWTFHCEHEGEKGPRSIDFSPDGLLLAAAQPDGVQLWDYTNFRETAFLPIGRTYSALFHPDGRSLFTSGSAGLKRWPLRITGQQVQIGPPEDLGAGENLYYCWLSADGRMLAAALSSKTGRLLVYDLETGRVTPLKRSGRFWSVAFSPDRRWLAAGTFGFSDVGIWNLETGEPETKLPINDTAQVAFSPDNKWLATATSTDYQLWEAGSWKPALSIPRTGARDHAGVLAFAPDGKTLAIAEGRTKVRLIDPDTGLDWATLEPPVSSEITRLRFSADGSRLAAATHDVQVWDLALIRRQLADMKLDWDLPPLAPPPTQAHAPISVTVLGITNAVSSR